MQHGRLRPPAGRRVPSPRPGPLFRLRVLRVSGRGLARGHAQRYGARGCCDQPSDGRVRSPRYTRSVHREQRVSGAQSSPLCRPVRSHRGHHAGPLPRYSKPEPTSSSHDHHPALRSPRQNRPATSSPLLLRHHHKYVFTHESTENKSKSHIFALCIWTWPHLTIILSQEN